MSRASCFHHTRALALKFKCDEMMKSDSDLSQTKYYELVMRSNLTVVATIETAKTNCASDFNLIWIFLVCVKFMQVLFLFNL